MNTADKSERKNWRLRLHEIVFEADTPEGRAFDIVVELSIVLSIIVVMLESVGSIREAHGALLFSIELFFTVLFTVEYAMRLISVGRPLKYATSFYGIVDLVAIAPTYLSFFLPGGEYLLTVRLLRLLRIFRVFKFVEYLGEARVLTSALAASRRKIIVFLFTVLTLVTVLGSMMYVIEGGENGFTSIPKSVYWAIVTITTVGYGDIAPKTALGQALASFVMILGYAIIAVPTGIVTVELSRATSARKVTTQACTECALEGHDADARFCRKCGARL